MKIAAIVVGAVAVIALNVLWGGYVGSVLWEWFVVSAFGLPKLTVAQAIGISLTATFFGRGLRDHNSSSSDDFGDQITQVVVIGFCFPLFGLGLGWLVKEFLP